MKDKRTIIFLALTFLWSWTSWFIGLKILSNGIDQETIGQFLPLFFVGLYGPTVSGIITSLVFDGFSGMLALLKKLFIWKAPISSYLYVVFLPLIFVAIGILLYSQLIGDIGEFDSAVLNYIPATLLAGIYAGPLGEELGWRGFLLPELQKRFSQLNSAIVIGVIWFLWHVPLWWAPFGTLVSGEPLSALPVLTYLVMLVCLSIIITWLVNRSNGSVLIALLFHLSINAGIAMLFFPSLGADFKTVHLLSSIGMIVFAGYLTFSDRMVITKR